MKYFFFLIILMTAGFAQAKGEPTSSDSSDVKVQAFIYSPELRYERNEDQGIEQIKAHSYSFAIHQGIFSGLLEYSNFGDKTGNQALSVDREHEDFLLWGRVHFYNIHQAYFDFNIYSGLGVGFYQESIKTTLDGESVQDNGGNQLEGALSLGTEGTVFFVPNAGIILGLELRALAGRDFDPNPQFSALARVGLEYVF